MRTNHRIASALVLALALIVPAGAMAGGLDGFLGELDIRASADLGAFKADLSLTFGTSESKVDGLFELMTKPGDVYMVLRLGEVAKQPLEQVVEAHQKNKGQGWGVIAKNLGIKPGSSEFHALKENRLSAHSGDESNKSSKKQGKGNGKG
jgi:hypothetical protein